MTSVTMPTTSVMKRWKRCDLGFRLRFFTKVVLWGAGFLGMRVLDHSVAVLIVAFVSGLMWNRLAAPNSDLGLSPSVRHKAKRRFIVRFKSSDPPVRGIEFCKPQKASTEIPRRDKLSPFFQESFRFLFESY